VQAAAQDFDISTFMFITSNPGPVSNANNPGPETDPDYENDPRSTAANAGNSVATSDVNPVAETIPSELTWDMVVESTASIGGIWSVFTAPGMGTAACNSAQTAAATGDFVILANSTYPAVTSGTLQVEFDLINSSDYPNVTMSVACGRSWINVN
jgi:hypothetical protein